MRPSILAAAALLALAAAPALAQTRSAPPADTAQAPIAAPTANTTPLASTAQMDAMNAAMAADDATLARLRAIDLARGLERMRAITPALAFHGPTFLFPNLYFGVPKPYPR